MNEWLAEYDRSDGETIGELRKMPYSDYLQSDYWRFRAMLARRAAGQRCQLCNAAGDLQVHHRTYDRIGNERPGDLIVLCAPCHDLFHSAGRLPEPPTPAIAGGIRA